MWYSGHLGNYGKSMLPLLWLHLESLVLESNYGRSRLSYGRTRKKNENQPFDIKHTLDKSVFNVICLAMFGTRRNYMYNDANL